ncbi:MAG: secretion system protein, partial [Pseudomonadota bacterium]|nr:secretion system protein [Pseudomonadota bacterium]
RSFRRGETELVIVVTPYLVKPVDAKDIKLPTDGYHTANEFQQLLGFQDQNGKNGEQRPGPRAADQESPAPDISAADPAATVPTGASKKPRRADKKKPGKKNRTAEAAAPGFSL